MSVVVAFGRRAFARPEGDGVETTLVELGNNAGDGETRGVDVENDRKIGVEVTEDWGRGEQGFELIECFLRS